MNEIISKCKDFLKRSCQRYSRTITRQIDEMNQMAGNFWTDSRKKTYHRTSSKKLNLTFSDLPVLANAIVSPYTNSPWHTELNNRSEQESEDIQNTINGIENNCDYKSVSYQAALRAICCGSGFCVVTTSVNEITNEPEVMLEFIQRQESVALDPDIETIDGSDAEEGAIVNYISINKAKRLYGDDVLPFDYPRSIPELDFTGLSQWSNEPNKIQIVSYYKKNEKGTVTYYKICGNKVLEEIELPIKYIPIVRFAGYQDYTESGVEYTGIVNKTFSLQLILNIAYSTLAERANRSIKANLIASTDAVEGLDQYYKKMTDEDGLMILHNKGTQAPIPLIESFQTADLRDIIQQSRELIADVIGVPLSGIIGLNDKTATEILVQQTNQQSNVSHFYNNFYKANRLISKIIIELLNEGKDLLFSLENGPDVITNNMKHRQELQTVANLLSPELQPIVAIAMCDTIDSKFITDIKNNIVSNLPTNIKLNSNSESDPFALHQLRQMQELVDNTMSELENTKMQLSELQKQNETLELSLMNQKESHILDMQKHQDEMILKMNELSLKANEQNMELPYKAQIEETKLQKEMLSLEKQKLELLGGNV